jgi:hypothetical protein
MHVLLDTLSSSDRVNLLELYARSVMLIELGRCSEWANLFLPQGVVRRAGSSDPLAVQQFLGRDELLVLGQQLIVGEFDLALGSTRPPTRFRHFLSNITLFADGPRDALGYAYLTVTTVAGTEPPRWLASGMYSDKMHKVPSGCWSFQSRTFTADGAVKVAFGAEHPSLRSSEDTSVRARSVGM